MTQVVGDATHLKGRPLSGALASGQCWVYDGTQLVPAPNEAYKYVDVDGTILDAKSCSDTLHVSGVSGIRFAPVSGTGAGEDGVLCEVWDLSSDQIPYWSEISGTAYEASGVAVYASGVAEGGSGIATGGSGIAVAAADIATDASGIAVGGSGIATGSSGIAVGASGIAVGASGLATAAVAELDEGRLFVPPAYYQTGSDEAYVLDSAQDWIAVRFKAETDFEIQTLSDFITAVVTQGDHQYEIYSDGTAIEPNGAFNGSTTNVAPVLTANNAPSPYVMSVVDANGNTAYAYQEPYKAMDGSTGTYLSVANSRYLTNGGVAVDKGGGKTGLPSIGHNAASGQRLVVSGTTNYEGTYTVDATSSTNEIVITHAYVAETFGAGAFCVFAPNANAPIYFALDLGSGNSRTINKMRLIASTSGFPGSVAYAGSNNAAPTRHTDTDWELPTDASWGGLSAPGSGATTEHVFTNGTAYRWHRWKISSIVDPATSNNVRLVEILFYSSQSQSAPGASQKVLGTLGSGAVADAWVRLTISAENRFPCQRGKTYWLVKKGAGGVSTSAGVRRVSTVNGSSHPDGCISKSTADGGLTWTQCVQNMLPALWNLIINSQPDHCPQIGFGAHTGNRVFIPGTGPVSIPDAGVFLDCSMLTAGIVYNVYGYDNSGVVALEPSTVDWTINGGVAVRSDDGTRRWLGRIVPIIINGGGYKGPVDVEDRRLVAYRGMKKRLGKPNPYSSSTYSSTGCYRHWTRWNSNDDWRMDFLSLAGTRIMAQVGCVDADAGRISVSFGLDGTVRHCDASSHESYGAYAGNVNVTIDTEPSPGVHILYPLLCPVSATTQAVLYYNANGDVIIPRVTGHIEHQ